MAEGKVNIGGVYKTILHAKVNIGGVWKLARTFRTNIDGVWKTNVIIPANWTSEAGNFGGSTIRFTYGGNWIDAYPIVYDSTHPDVYKIQDLGFEYASGNFVQYKLMASPSETGNESTFVDTGLRVTPSDYTTVNYITQAITTQTIRRVVWIPVSWSAASYSYSFYYPRLYYYL